MRRLQRGLKCHRWNPRRSGSLRCTAPGAERGEFRRAEPLGIPVACRRRLSRQARRRPPDHPAHLPRLLSSAAANLPMRCGGAGSAPGDTVAVMAPNVPALLEAHYGVPMAGAVLNALNYRLDARSIAFILAHGQAKLLIADREFSPIVKEALDELAGPMPLVEIDDGSGGASLGGTEYEDFLAEGDPAAAWSGPQDEWEPIALNYTSGTTGNPKGVVYPPSRRFSECDRQCDHLRARPQLGLSVDLADVSLQRLDLHLGSDGNGRHPCLSAPCRTRGDFRRRSPSTGSRISAAPRSS